MRRTGHAARRTHGHQDTTPPECGGVPRGALLDTARHIRLDGGTLHAPLLPGYASGGPRAQMFGPPALQSPGARSRVRICCWHRNRATTRALMGSGEHPFASTPDGISPFTGKPDRQGRRSFAAKRSIPFLFAARARATPRCHHLSRRRDARRQAGRPHPPPSNSPSKLLARCTTVAGRMLLDARATNPSTVPSSSATIVDGSKPMPMP
jgi:hypothetical protein